MVQGKYEHADLVLAATLSISANINGEMSRRGDQVIWQYDRSQRLDEMLAEFHSGRCLVEPLAFAKVLRHMRNRVYTLMDYNPPPVQPSGGSS